jgi:hypothetical protein
LAPVDVQANLQLLSKVRRFLTGSVYDNIRDYSQQLDKAFNVGWKPTLSTTSAQSSGLYDAVDFTVRPGGIISITGTMLDPETNDEFQEAMLLHFNSRMDAVNSITQFPEDLQVPINCRLWYHYNRLSEVNGELSDKDFREYFQKCVARINRIGLCNKKIKESWKRTKPRMLVGIIMDRGSSQFQILEHRNMTDEMIAEYNMLFEALQEGTFGPMPDFVKTVHQFLYMKAGIWGHPLNGALAKFRSMREILDPEPPRIMSDYLDL